MRILSRILLGTALACSALASTSVPAAAQALNGRQLPDRPVVSAGYYKTPPGKQDEWLQLYLKWHRPIMEHEIKEGTVISSTVYANSSHALAPQWDFVIINVSPAPNQAKKSSLTRGEVIRKLFPDLDAYTAGEKARWALTEGHWDERLIEVDLTAKNPGVYYPILPANK